MEEIVVEEGLERMRPSDGEETPSLGELLAQIPQDDLEFERLPLIGRAAKTLQIAMDEMSPEAESRGLTLEVLEDILSDE